MSIKSGLFAAITTVVLMLALGNTWVVEKSFDAGFAQDTRLGISGSLRFQVGELPSEIRGTTIVRLVLLILLTAVLGGIVGRARPLAAFVGGWGAFLAASVVSAGVYGLLLDDRFVGRPGADTVDTFTSVASSGTPLGMWLGWLVGLAVLLGSFGKGQPKPATAYAPPPPAGSWGAPPAPAPQSWDQPPPPAPAPPAWDQPAAPAPPASPPPASGGPVIGAPPDRTQIYGEPHRDA